MGESPEDIREIGDAARTLLGRLKAHQTRDDGAIAHGRTVTRAWLAAMVRRHPKTIQRQLVRLEKASRIVVKRDGRGFKLWIADAYRLRGEFTKSCLAIAEGAIVLPLKEQSCSVSQPTTAPDPQQWLMLGPMASNLRSSTTSGEDRSKAKAREGPRAAYVDFEDETPLSRSKRQLEAMERGIHRGEREGFPRSEADQLRRVMIGWFNEFHYIEPAAVEPALEQFFEKARRGELRHAYGYLRMTLLRRHRQERENAAERESDERRRLAKANGPR